MIISTSPDNQAFTGERISILNIITTFVMELGKAHWMNDG